MALYVDNLERYKNQKVTIHPGSFADIDVIQGIILEPTLSIGSDAEIGPADGSDVEAMIRGAAKSVANKISGYLGDKVDRHSRSLMSSAEGWTGGSPFQFTLSFQVFKRGVGGVGKVASYSDLENNLAKYTQTRTDTNEPMQQPHYYDFVKFTEAIAKNKKSDIEGSLFTVSIGSWFKARLLLPISQNVDYSTITTSDGSPLYATVTVSFKTYRPLTAKELARIVRK